LKKPAEKGPELVKIVRPSHVDVVADSHLRTLIEAGHAKENNGDLLAQSRALANPPGDCNRASWIDPWTDENQVGRVKAGL